MAKLQRWRRRAPAADGQGAAPGPTPRTPSSDRVSTLQPEPESEQVAPVEEGRAEEAPAEREPTASARVRRSVLESAPVLLVLAAHPRQALLTSAGMGIAALAADRPPREAAVIAATVLVGQTVLGWHNDIVDRQRDARHATRRKPVADGRLEVGSVWYAIVIAVLLVVPLSISTGVTAGSVYLGALAVGLLGNVALRSGRFSWLPWAAQFALYPAYLSLGGWGGGAEGDPPQVAMTVLAALLGVGVHFLRAIWGLVADDDDGWTYLPLRLGRRLGATRLLVLSGAYTAVVGALLVIVGGTVGLRQ